MELLRKLKFTCKFLQEVRTVEWAADYIQIREL